MLDFFKKYQRFIRCYDKINETLFVQNISSKDNIRTATFNQEYSSFEIAALFLVPYRWWKSAVKSKLDIFYWTETFLYCQCLSSGCWFLTNWPCFTIGRSEANQTTTTRIKRIFDCETTLIDSRIVSLPLSAMARNNSMQWHFWVLNVSAIFPHKKIKVLPNDNIVKYNFRKF